MIKGINYEQNKHKNRRKLTGDKGTSYGRLVLTGNVDIEGVEMKKLKRLALEQIDPLASSSDMGVFKSLFRKRFIMLFQTQNN